MADSAFDDSTPKSSTALSERARRQRRRDRDARAERRAFLFVAGAVLVVGAALWIGVGYWAPESPAGAPPAAVTGDPAAPSADPGGAPEARRAEAPTLRRHSTFEEPVDLPALRALQQEGLTIAAEGLPEVLTDQKGPTVDRWAAELSCRFAYGVWEFSPNRRFRFLTTCKALRGQRLVGAYDVEETALRLSPLSLPNATLSTTFYVERPSRLKTDVVVTSRGTVVTTFRILQRVTVIRPGLEADGFLQTFAPKNHLGIPSGSRTSVPPRERGASGRAAPPRDPVLDLLKAKP